MAMYDKAETEDLRKFKSTPYWEAVKNFQKHIMKEGRSGLPPSGWAKQSMSP